MLNERQNNSGTYLRIIDGSICRKSDNAQDGFEPFETKNPSTNQPVHYFIKRYESIDGFLTGFVRVDKPDVKVHGWQMTLTDNGENFHLSLADNRSTTTRVLKMLRSVDLNEKIVISVWKDKDGKTAIIFKQNDENVKQNFDNTNLPAPKERPGGKFDYSESEDILYEDAVEFSRTLATETPVAQATESTPTHTGTPADTGAHHPDCKCDTCQPLPF